MTYAQGRIINDADSHIMELPDFLKKLRGRNLALADQMREAEAVVL